MTRWMIAMGFLSATGSEGHYTLSSPDVSGEFSSPPVVQWVVPLPVPPHTSASHTELGGPVLHGDEIFIGSAAADALLVLDRRDGHLLRQLPTTAPVQAPVVIDGELLYFSDTSGTTWCYPLEGEEPLWSHYSGAPVLSSPTIADGRVYISNVDNLVYALDAGSGELVWRYAHRIDPTRTAELELYGAPSPVLAGETVLTGFSDGALIALSVEGGEALWSRRVGEGKYPDLIAPAMVREDDILVAGYTEPLLALDRTNQAVRWRLEIGGPQAVVEAEGLLLHGGGDGLLRALDAQTGDQLWEWDSQTGSALTQPIPTPAGLLVGASAGSVYLVNTLTGALLWEYDPGYFLAGVTSTPAVGGRQAVVLTNAGNLISFIVPRSDDAPRSRPMVERPPKGPR